MAEGKEKKIRYEYNENGELIKVREEGGKRLARYGCNEAGELIWEELGEGKIRSEYSYEEGGELERLLTKTEEGKVLLNYSYVYDEVGNRIEKRGEGERISYTYDKLN